MEIFNFLRNNILGQLGDQVGSIWLGNIFFESKTFLFNYYSLSYFQKFPEDFNTILFSNIYNFIYLSISFFLGGVFSYNLLLVLILFSNSLCFFLLLRELKISKEISLIFSIFFSFIPYFYIHYEHQPLIILFPSLIIIRLLLKELFDLKKIIFISVLFFAQINISLYLGYFLAIYLFFWFLIKTINERSLKFLFIFSKIFVLTISLFIILSFKFISSYFYPALAIKEYSFPNEISSKEISTFGYKKVQPIEDFIYFSSRPWYFFLYHSTHPLFGDTSKRIVSFFANDLNFWIFKNYFPAEHNASFIGYTIIFLIILGLKRTNITQKNYINNFLILSIILFILSMPPIIYFKEIKIYLPSYLLYLFFPMFRSLARISIYLNINLFIVASYFYSELYRDLSINKKYFFTILLVSFFILDYSFKVKYTEVNPFFETSNFLLNNNKESYFIAVYPQSIRYDFLLNMHIHQSPLFNPPGVSYSELNFDSTNFTKNIDDCRNLGFFKELKGKYIIIKNYNENEFENVSKLRTVYESDKENIIIKSVDNLTSICK